MRSKLKAVIAAARRLEAAQKDVLSALRDAYPIGSVVHWTHGNPRSAEVVDHVWCQHPRTWVRGLRAPFKTYSVESFCIWNEERTRIKHEGVADV